MHGPTLILLNIRFKKSLSSPEGGDNAPKQEEEEVAWERAWSRLKVQHNRRHFS